MLCFFVSEKYRWNAESRGGTIGIETEICEFAMEKIKMITVKEVDKFFFAFYDSVSMNVDVRSGYLDRFRERGDVK